MNISITNTDELTVWLLLSAVLTFMTALVVLIYCCVLMFETRHRLKELRRPEVDRDGEWPRIRRHERN